MIPPWKNINTYAPSFEHIIANSFLTDHSTSRDFANSITYNTAIYAFTCSHCGIPCLTKIGHVSRGMYPFRIGSGPDPEAETLGGTNQARGQGGAKPWWGVQGGKAPRCKTIFCTLDAFRWLSFKEY